MNDSIRKYELDGVFYNIYHFLEYQKKQNTTRNSKEIKLYYYTEKIQKILDSCKDTPIKEEELFSRLLTFEVVLAEYDKDDVKTVKKITHSPLHIQAVLS